MAPQRFITSPSSLSSVFIFALGVTAGGIAGPPPVVPVKATVVESSTSPWNVCGPHGCAPVEQICGPWGCAMTEHICPSSGCEDSYSSGSPAGNHSAGRSTVKDHGSGHRLFDPEGYTAQQTLDLRACSGTGGCAMHITDLTVEVLPHTDATLCNCGSFMGCNCGLSIYALQQAGSRELTLQVCGDGGCLTLDKALAAIAGSAGVETTAKSAKSEL